HGVQWAFHNAFRVIEGDRAVARPVEDDSQSTSVILSNLEQYHEQKRLQQEKKKRE
ncbi:hypothetical protein ACJ72_03506, partial [Emergomyces africanus]